MDNYSLSPQERKTFLSFVCTDGCQDLDDHEHFARGDAFRWCWPRFTLLRPADPSLRVGLNRYPHNVIGAYVIAFGRGIGVRWKRA